LAILITVVILIVYGSLYPWIFVDRALLGGPFYILLHSWNVEFSRRFVFDVAVNVAIYIPLGMSGYLAFRRFRFLGPIILATLLSTSIEIAQLFTPYRVCSLVDLTNNVIGSAVGVLAGLLFTRIVDLPEIRIRDRVAVAMLFCWVSFLLFPLFPDISLPDLRAKLLTFPQPPLIDPIPILLSTAEWFAAARFLKAAGAQPYALFALFLLVPAQFTIVNHNPVPADFIGPALAAAASFFLRDRSGAILLLLAITARGLAPFRFSGPPQSFLWIPFEGMLNAPWQDSIQILLGKLFQYGAAIWLLTRAGLGLLRAAVLVTLTLTGIEALQILLPSHTAEITDPLLAVLLSTAFRLMRGTVNYGRLSPHQGPKTID
jgi:glycopeptide antibiotics resistance protein